MWSKILLIFSFLKHSLSSFMLVFLLVSVFAVFTRRWCAVFPGERRRATGTCVMSYGRPLLKCDPGHITVDILSRNFLISKKEEPCLRQGSSERSLRMMRKGHVLKASMTQKSISSGLRPEPPKSPIALISAISSADISKSYTSIFSLILDSVTDLGSGITLFMRASSGSPSTLP